jgi:DNA-binding IclR family transcriptional regulator
MAVRAKSRPAADEADRSADGRVKSADRVMSVLDLVAASGSLSFTEIVERLGLPKSSAHALLRTMEDRGYLTLDPQAKEYRLGSRIWELAQAHHGIEDLRTVMKPLMDGVMERTGETVQLARLEGTDAVYLELSESPHAMKLTSRVGARLPAHASAIGKSLLASLEHDEARGRLAAADRPRLTARTITDADELLAELERVRRQGYSVDNEEFATGLRCIAMPVRDATGRAVGAMSVAMPTPRYSRAAAANARRALADAVAMAAESLGRWPE